MAGRAIEKKIVRPIRIITFSVSSVSSFLVLYIGLIRAKLECVTLV
jgi:hypothetical protein